MLLLAAAQQSDAGLPSRKVADAAAHDASEMIVLSRVVDMLVREQSEQGQECSSATGGWATRQQQFATREAATSVNGSTAAKSRKRTTAQLSPPITDATLRAVLEALEALYGDSRKAFCALPSAKKKNSNGCSGKVR